MSAAGLIAFLRRRCPPSTSDADLLRVYADRRDPDAFRVLLERHGPRDTTALVWDVAALTREPPIGPLAADEAMRLSAEWAGEAPAALRAVDRRAAAPNSDGSFL